MQCRQHLSTRLTWFVTSNAMPFCIKMYGVARRNVGEFTTRIPDLIVCWNIPSPFCGAVWITSQDVMRYGKGTECQCCNTGLWIWSSFTIWDIINMSFLLIKCSWVRAICIYHFCSDVSWCFAMSLHNQLTFVCLLAWLQVIFRLCF